MMRTISYAFVLFCALTNYGAAVDSRPESFEGLLPEDEVVGEHLEANEMRYDSDQADANEEGEKSKDQKEDCIPTKGPGAGNGRRCVFPFTLNLRGVSKTCHGPTCCNLDNDFNGPWCSTKVRSNGDYIIGYRGYCKDTTCDPLKDWKMTTGRCLTCGGERPPDEKRMNADSWECLKKCQRIPNAKGCEYRHYRTCIVHMVPVDRGDHREGLMGGDGDACWAPERNCQGENKVAWVSLRNAVQSSKTQQWPCRGNVCSADQAIDDDESTEARTDWKAFSWWRAEMAKTVKIDRILLYSTTAITSRNDFKVETRMNENDPWTVCTRYSTQKSIFPMVVRCDKPTIARYLRLAMGERPAALRLLEVKVVEDND